MKKRVIIVADGDEYAKRNVEYAAKHFGGRCITRSYGNPTPITGIEIVELILQTPYDPVFVMFDDGGLCGVGQGELAMITVASHPEIEVIGAIAVAAKTNDTEWTKVDVSVDKYGELTSYGVDKSGTPDVEVGRINGDTVYSLDQLDLPIVVGIGDIGKMSEYDSVENGCPITIKAIQLILERSGSFGK